MKKSTAHTVTQKTLEKSGKFVIVKYQNRKLYSPLLATYVTLADVLLFYKKYRSKFQVISAVTNEDLTNQHLIAAAAKKAESNAGFQKTLINVITKTL